MVTERIGEWMQTYSGRRVYVSAPRASDVAIEDIAHHLSMVCRFGGAVTHFYCPTPEQRVLTADLRWVAAGDLRVGDELVGFDEHPTAIGTMGKRRRHFRHATVRTNVEVRRHVIRLEMADGTTARASSEHPWLVATKQARNHKWQTTSEIASAIRAGCRRHMHKFVEPWSYAPSREAGWLAGMYDGEGCLSIANRRGTQLGLSQRPGRVLDEAARILDTLGFRSLSYVQTGAPSGDVLTLQMRGGWRAIARLLGTVRPIRLLNTFIERLRGGEFDKQMDGVATPLEIIRAYDEGEQACAGLETSTRTYLCEGFGAHNSVAEHAVRVSRLVEELKGTPHEIFWGLNHDDSEAYLGDIVWPLKQAIEMTGYKKLERAWMLAICEALAMAPEQPSIVKHADLVMLATEKRDLIRGTSKTVAREADRASAELEGWHCDTITPHEERIQPWTPRDAELAFLERYALCAERRLGKRW